MAPEQGTKDGSTINILNDQFRRTQFRILTSNEYELDPQPTGLKGTHGDRHDVTAVSEQAATRAM